MKVINDAYNASPDPRVRPEVLRDTKEPKIAVLSDMLEMGICRGGARPVGEYAVKSGVDIRNVGISAVIYSTGPRKGNGLILSHYFESRREAAQLLDSLLR